MVSINSPHPPPGPDPRDQRVALWVDALRRKADAATLQSLPTLSDADAARVMALLRMDAAPQAPFATTSALQPKPAVVRAFWASSPKASWGPAATA